MKFLHHSAPLLLATASACFGLAIVPRSAEEPSVTTVFQFNQTGSQFENMAVRQSGTILTTRIDVPDIWEVNPLTHRASKRFAIPEATGVLGIAEVTHDVFVLAAANLTSGSMQVWVANLNFKIPRVSLVTAMRDARLLNGVARWDDRTVLVADSTQGVIYKVDVKTGEYSVALADESMTVRGGDSVGVGVNGIKVLGGFVYYTSLSRQLFCRIAVDESAASSGPAQVIASGFIQDDFTLTPDGTAYIATMTGNTVVKVTPNGTVFTIAGRADSLEVASCSACQFGRTAADKDILYVASAGGLLAPVNGIVEPSKIVAVNLSSAAPA